MRGIVLLVLLAAGLLAGCTLIEPTPGATSGKAQLGGWRRTADGWEYLRPRPAARAWYTAALHPVLVGLLLGQAAVGCLVWLPQSSPTPASAPKRIRRA